MTETEAEAEAEAEGREYRSEDGLIAVLIAITEDGDYEVGAYSAASGRSLAETEFFDDLSEAQARAREWASEQGFMLEDEEAVQSRG